MPSGKKVTSQPRPSSPPASHMTWRHVWKKTFHCPRGQVPLRDSDVCVCVCLHACVHECLGACVHERACVCPTWTHTHAQAAIARLGVFHLWHSFTLWQAGWCWCCHKIQRLKDLSHVTLHGCEMLVWQNATGLCCLRNKENVTRLFEVLANNMIYVKKKIEWQVATNGMQSMLLNC